MSVSAASTSSQSVASLVLQQLLSGTNAQATAGLSPAVLQAVLQSANTTQQSAQGAPAAVTQALGDLLSGSDPSQAQSDLAQLQSYFQQNPDSLASLLSTLQSSAATYTANGTLSSSSSLLSALEGTSGSSSSGSALTSLLSALQGTSGSSSSGSVLSALLGGQSQDPLLAALNGSSSSSDSSISMLG